MVKKYKWRVEKEAYLSTCNGELFLALLALSGLIIFQPGMPLIKVNTR